MSTPAGSMPQEKERKINVDSDSFGTKEHMAPASLTHVVPTPLVNPRPSAPTLLGFPHELALYMIQFLDLQDLSKLAEVSISNYFLALDKHYWLSRLLKKFYITPKMADHFCRKYDLSNYRQLYQHGVEAVYSEAQHGILINIFVKISFPFLTSHSLKLRPWLNSDYHLEALDFMVKRYNYTYEDALEVLEGCSEEQACAIYGGFPLDMAKKLPPSTTINSIVQLIAEEVSGENVGLLELPEEPQYQGLRQFKHTQIKGTTLNKLQLLIWQILQTMGTSNRSIEKAINILLESDNLVLLLDGFSPEAVLSLPPLTGPQSMVYNRLRAFSVEFDMTHLAAIENMQQARAFYYLVATEHLPSATALLEIDRMLQQFSGDKLKLLYVLGCYGVTRKHLQNQIWASEDAGLRLFKILVVVHGFSPDRALVAMEQLWLNNASINEFMTAARHLADGIVESEVADLPFFQEVAMWKTNILPMRPCLFREIPTINVSIEDYDNSMVINAYCNAITFLIRQRQLSLRQALMEIRGCDLVQLRAISKGATKTQAIITKSQLSATILSSSTSSSSSSSYCSMIPVLSLGLKSCDDERNEDQEKEAKHKFATPLFHTPSAPRQTHNPKTGDKVLTAQDQEDDLELLSIPASCRRPAIWRHY